MKRPTIEDFKPNVFWFHDNSEKVNMPRMYVKALEDYIDHIEQSQSEMIKKVKLIYANHKVKLDILKENRAMAEELFWTDDEILSVDEQIVRLASILSDLNRNILNPNK